MKEKKIDCRRRRLDGFRHARRRRRGGTFKLRSPAAKRVSRQIDSHPSSLSPISALKEGLCYSGIKQVYDRIRSPCCTVETGYLKYPFVPEENYFIRGFT